jgi:hypothetical protein
MKISHAENPMEHSEVIEGAKGEGLVVIRGGG